MDKKRAYTVKDHIYKALLYEVIDERTFTYNMGIGTDPPLCCTIAIARCQERLVPSIGEYLKKEPELLKVKKMCAYGVVD